MALNIPPIIKRMLERPPILVDEDRAGFCDLFEMVCDDEQPQTTQEWLLVADIACADFEIFRLRGLKVRAFHAGLTETWQIEIDDRTEYVDLEGRPVWLNRQAPLRKLVVGGLAGNVSSKVTMANYLERRGLTMESLVGATFAETTSTQLLADRLVNAVYRRRSALYADLERARARRSWDLPAAVGSPLMAPNDAAENAQVAAPEDAPGDNVGQPSSADEGH